MKVAAINITDKSREVLEAMKEQVILGLAAVGQEAEGYAKEGCPVDTGRLRNSITNKVEEGEMAVYIGTNVEYAPKVEYEDREHKTGGAHFLRNAVSDHTDHFKTIIEAALKN